MRTTVLGLVLFSLMAPAIAFAQVQGYPQGAPVQGYPQGAPVQGYPQGAPVQGYPQGVPVRPGTCGEEITPPGQVIYDRLMHHFAPANLAPQQTSQMGQMVAQFSRMHPAGSRFDHPAMRELRSSIDAMLAPQQQAAMRAARESEPRHEHCR